MSNNQTSLQSKVAKANQVGKLLPETLKKVEFYEEVLSAENDLIQLYKKRQSSPFVSGLTKAKERVEITRLTDSVYNKSKMYENYKLRKEEFENWMNEMAIEVTEKWSEVMEKAKSITTNLRLVSALKTWEERGAKNLQEKIEFYLYLCQEIANYKKHSK
jgi:hypothetical protein